MKRIIVSVLTETNEDYLDQWCLFVRNYIPSDDAIKILKQTQPSLAIITHFGNKMIQADILCETRKIQQESKVQVIAAKDGMKVNPESYSSKLKTKTLNLYK